MADERLGMEERERRVNISEGRETSWMEASREEKEVEGCNESIFIDFELSWTTSCD